MAASHSVNGAYVPKGIGEAGSATVKAVSEQDLTVGQTLSVVLPSGIVFKGMVPMYMAAWTLSAGVWTLTALTLIGVMTTYTESTGTLLITAAGSVPKGTIVVVKFERL